MNDDAGRGAGLQTLLEAWRRRRLLGLLVLAAALTASAGLAAYLPDVYRASATVLVERRNVTESFVRPGQNDELETRLQTISQQVLSRARLNELIDRFRLYPEMRAHGVSADFLAQWMSRDLHLERRAAGTSDGRQATIAFTLSYRGKDPQTVAQVTNALAGIYVEENLRTRGRQAAGAATFLKTELEEAKARLDERERHVADYKRTHSGELPQQMEANLATLERLSGQLHLNSEKQGRLQERRDDLLEQRGDLGPADAAGEPETASARIGRLRRDLIGLKSRYRDVHPEVVRVKSEIAELERLLQNDPVEPVPPEGEASDATAASRGEALAGLDAELRSIQREESALRRAIDQYQKRVESAPGREQELLEISRDYETARESYASLLKRYEDAQLNESMEELQQGEQFRILDPAEPPQQPSAPNRPGLLLAGLALSCALAAGAMVLAERLDSSLHTVEELRAFSRVPILATIARIPSRAERRRTRRRAFAGAVAATAGLGLILGVTYIVARVAGPLVLTLAGAHP